MDIRAICFKAVMNRFGRAEVSTGRVHPGGRGTPLTAPVRIMGDYGTIRRPWFEKTRPVTTAVPQVKYATDIASHT
jgi:hypothetical protein